MLLLFTLLISVNVAGQYYTNQNKVWVFGYNAGVDFTSGSPVAISTNINQSEGCASVSSSSGNLLFYTDGKNIYNKLSALMTHGSSVVSFTTSSSTQSALIVPMPGNTSKYYVFSLQETGGAGYLEYCIVDMTLSGGYGDVVTGTAGTVVGTGFSEKMTAIPGNSCDIWLMAHMNDSAVFKAYDITATGIASPVISRVGSFSGTNAYGAGVLKASPNRLKLVAQTYAYTTAKGTEIFDFSPTTGVVSNCQLLNSTTSQYGAEFSPDNTKLYVDQWATGIIYQYDISLTTTSAIISSMTAVTSTSAGYSDLKLGPDNKIYVSSNSTSYLDCFNTPNGAGSSCGYTAHAVALSSGTHIYYGLPNIVVVESPNDTAYSAHDTIACLPISGGITISAHDSLTGSSYIWSDGVTTTSTLSGITSAGSYWVYIYNGCFLHIDTIQVSFFSTAGAISGAGNICQGQTTTLTDTSSGGTWSSSSLSATVGSTGTVTGVSPGAATITYTLPTGCYATKTITVYPVPPSISGITALCAGSTIALTDSTAGGIWTSSDITRATIGSSSGTVTGVALGTAIISYILPTGCAATKMVTVNPGVAAITGTSNICLGATSTLSDITPGGSWSSANPAVAAIGSSTGVVTGVATGIASITYTTSAGCFSVTPVTINSLPTAITGVTSVCIGAITTLYDGGGNWSSSSPTIITIGSLTGIVTGISTGSATITYTIPTGCFTTVVMTVNPSPSAILGSSTLCLGLLDTLTDTTAGGYWSSSDITYAYIDAGTGVITGVGTGSATITYTLGTGCYVTMPVTVNPAPTPITGVAGVCTGSSTALYDGVSGGVWSSGTPAVAVIGSATGVYTGVTVGSTLMTYSMGVGCNATFSVHVYPIPVPITGATHLCPGGTTTLTDGTVGGTWSSSLPGIATIGSATGVVTAVTAGVTTISYSFGLGVTCAATTPVTVNPLPATITGITHACPGTTTTLSDGGGGTWLSGTPWIATIGSTSGVVSGIATGTTTITYTLPTGCSTTIPVTINPLPAAIAGASTLCVGTVMALTDGTPGGTWSRSNTNVTIGSATGVVTGVTSGTTVITYTLPTGCYMTKTITVNTTAGAITGSLQVCPGTTTALSDPTGGGTWASSAPGTATIGSATGVVTGIVPGSIIVTYSTGSGCTATATVTVNTLPTSFTVTGGGSYCAGGTGLHVGLSASAIGVSYQLYNGGVATGTAISGTGGALDFGPQTAAGTYTVIADVTATGCTRNMAGSVTITINPLPTPVTGPSAVCIGSTIAETDPGGGTWLSSSPAIATIGSATGIAMGVAIGTTTITYTLPTACYITKTVTVSVSPTAISGTSAVCAGDSITLTDGVGGGAWSSAVTAIATVGSSTGVVNGVAAGATSITYSLGTGCAVFKTISVNAMPAAITGSMVLCAGHTTTLSSTTTGGTWMSGATTIATVGSTTGVVNGITTGAAGITYTVGAGCKTTATVTVNTVPTAISGVTHVCIGRATTLSDGASGGTWTSSAPGVATVGSATGIVTGVTAGTATITYSLGSGCAVNTLVTVNTLPLAIGGTSALCAGATATATDGSTGGTWSCPSTGIATIGSSTGLITGVSAGVATISYTTSSGCMATKPVTINPLPSVITGATTVCVGQATTLSDATTGGTWSSSNTAIATVGSGTGTVTGVAAGTATITYTLPTGCMATTPVTVNPPPSPITGTGSVCAGAATTLSDAVTGGTWSSGATTIATVGSSSGLVTGVAAGTAVVSYAIGSGCSAIKTVTVNALPPGITGSATACVGAATTLSDAVTGGSWSSSNTAIATVGSGTGIVSGVNAGTVIITYATSAGCTTILWMTINPPPPAITGGSGVCSGSTITLGDPATGGSWSSSNTSIATVSTTGVVTGGMTGGSVTISYTVSTGCAATHTVSVTAVPAITGLYNLCAWGDTLTAHDASIAGLYSSTLVTVMNLGGGAGLVTANAPGTAHVTYTLTSGCAVTTTITVYPLPGLITGTTHVCAGSTTTLSNTVTGGVWSSGATTIAVVGSATGVVTGVAAGVAYITYTLPTGCKADTAVHVNPDPAMIAGYPTMIVSTTATYTDATTGGVWSSSNPAVATIGASTGSAHGVAAGVVTFSYTISTGCAATKVVSVNILGGVSPLGSEDPITTITGSEIRAIPNPNRGTFTISGTLGTAATKEDEEVWLELTDMLGQVVYRNKILSHDGKIEEDVLLSNIANGMYLLSVRWSDGSKVMHVVVAR